MVEEIEISEVHDAIEPSVTAEIIESVPAVLASSDTEAEVIRRQQFIRYILLPGVFLTVALLGGLRFSSADSSFIFLKPALICLVFALMLLAMFFRSGLLSVEGWFSENFEIRHNLANGAVMLSLFAASVQIFNALIPEQGLPFWVISFCFLWVLWNNLFGDFDAKRLIKSLGALFGFAFVTKYMALAYLTAPAGKNWLRSLIENPAQEAFTWFLDLPRFSPATGYVQFFTMIIFLFGLFLLPVSTRSK